MSDTSNVTATTELQRKLKELEDLTRVLTNGLNWLSDVEIKVAYIQPINEFVSFLTGFKANIEQQQEALKGVMPKVEAKQVELTEAK